MLQMKHNKIDSFDLLRFPLAVFIVTEHIFETTVGVIGGERIECTHYPMFMALNEFISAFIRTVGVPVFFFISGYLFFLHTQWGKEIYIKKIKSRFHTLFIPYILWISLEILLTVVTHLPVFSEWTSYAGTKVNLSLHAIISCFWNYGDELVSISDAAYQAKSVPAPYPLVIPLWFLRDLLIVVICTPIIHTYIRRFKFYGLVILAMLMLSPVPHRMHLLISAFFYFSCGAYMSILNKDLTFTFSRYCWLSLIAYLTAGMLIFTKAIPNVGGFLTIIKGVSAIVLSYNLATVILKHSYCKVSYFLASSAFFIYAAHGLLTQRVKKIGLMLVKPDSDWEMIVMHVGLEIFTVAGLLLCFYLLQRYFKPVLKLLTGRT